MFLIPFSYIVLVVILAAFFDFLGVEFTFGCCSLTSFSQINDMIYDIIDIIAGICSMSP